MNALACEGRCPEGSQCRERSRTNHHGGIRKWCDCDDDKQQPSQCHAVLYTPGRAEGGGEPQILCAGSCPQPGYLCRKVVDPENGEVRCECQVDLEAQKRKIQEEIDALDGEYALGGIEKEEWERRRKKLEEELKRIEESLKKRK